MSRLRATINCDKLDSDRGPVICGLCLEGDGRDLTFLPSRRVDVSFFPLSRGYIESALYWLGDELLYWSQKSKIPSGLDHKDSNQPPVRLIGRGVDRVQSVPDQWDREKAPTSDFGTHETLIDGIERDKMAK